MTVTRASDFTAITEMPGGLVTSEQRARLWQRYTLATAHAAGRRVLEVACGAGLGLGVVAEKADWLIGGDFTAPVLEMAHRHYGGAVPLARFDAQRLPFRDGSLDLILCFEAIYYFPQVGSFLAECRRVLAGGGLLVIGSENRAWPHFAPGPLSVRYYAAPELNALLIEAGFGPVEFLGSFAAEAYGLGQQARARLRRAITATGVFQRWPQVRELLKPLVYRDAAPLRYGWRPDEERLFPLVSLDPREDNSQFKVIYALAHHKTVARES